MLVQNNFLYNKDFVKIYYYITEEKFPWYMCKDLDSFKLTHPLVKNINNKKISSLHAPKILSPLLKKIGVADVVWAKLDCYLKTKEILNYDAEELTEESDQNFIGFLFMNTNNSSIEILNENKTEAKENKFMCFKKNIPYFQTSHTDVDKKIVLSLEYSI
jgi:hypothetical protein|tara:strand:- start:16 stop:495 length:480 start_codon:yes stop_codon:yes gene_type:complete